MTFALDASIVLAWAFPDEEHPIADSALVAAAPRAGVPLFA